MRTQSIRSMFVKAVTASVLGAAAVSGSVAVAQDSFPEKSVLAIVPFGAGGGNDILLRLMAKHAGEVMGQTLVIENKPGASGQIGWTTLAKSRPDGYTIGATSLPSMVLVKAMRPNTPFELSDFTYICNIQVDPIVWVVNADGPYTSGKSFVAAAEKAKQPLNVAGDGPQSNVQLQHLSATEALGVKTNFVPFNGSNAALTALMGSKVEMAASTLSAAQNYIDSGKLKALVVFSDEPIATIPNVPTASAELGKAIEPVGMAIRGLAAPKGVPADRIGKLESVCKQTAESPDFQKEAAQLGLMIQYMDSNKAEATIQASVKAVESLKELLK
ncbi:MAG: tripartite tricarboxylate transporter substrate binding protein [Castellaniella sp.]|uniref:tripartite tricarboxylate transporter substrate binding protein n=1 Tax=Castellaniella sp. TaxID=1955812 RepID=UPI003C7682BB